MSVSSAVRATQIRRRRAKSAAEAAVEVGHVAKAAGVGDVDDLHSVMGRVSEHRNSPLEPKLEHALGEARAGFLKKVLNVALRQSGPTGNRLGGKAWICEPCLDGLQD